MQKSRPEIRGEVHPDPNPKLIALLNVMSGKAETGLFRRSVTQSYEDGMDIMFSYRMVYDSYSVSKIVLTR